MLIFIKFYYIKCNYVRSKIFILRCYISIYVIFYVKICQNYIFIEYFLLL